MMGSSAPEAARSREVAKLRKVSRLGEPLEPRGDRPGELWLQSDWLDVPASVSQALAHIDAPTANLISAEPVTDRVLDHAALTARKEDCARHPVYSDNIDLVRQTNENLTICGETCEHC